MKKLVWKPGALLAPTPPTLVSCGDMEHPNILTIAWAGIVNTHPPMTFISVRPERYSYPLILEQGEFVINLTPASLIRAADFCGVRSGKEVNKWEACGLTPAPASKVHAPLIEECPVALECKVRESTLLGTHRMFLADIVAVDVDAKLVNSSGKLDLAKADLACYIHGEYFSLGKSLGTFGFSVRKKTKRRAKK